MPALWTDQQSQLPRSPTSPFAVRAEAQSASRYLLQYQLLPYERTRELLNDWFGYRLSAASLAGFVRECAGKLVRSEAQIKARLKQAPIIHVDETGLRVAKRGQYIHVASTANLTHYGCHEKRGREAMDEISILPQYQGTCVHDGWRSYRLYGQCLHSLCGAHLLRELTYLSEASEQEKKWAEPLTRILLEMKDAAEAARANGRKHVAKEQARQLTRRYDELIEENWHNHQQSEARAGPECEAEVTNRQATAVSKQSRNLLLRLRLQRDEVLRFMSDLQVPFDNNQAERDLRMVKLQQKIEGCFRSQTGARQFCRIRGYVSTQLKRVRQVLMALESVFER